MYAFLFEKSLRFAKLYGIGGTFNLAIWIFFTRVFCFICLSGLLKLSLKVIISDIWHWIPATRLRGHKLFNGNDITFIHH